MTTLSEFIASWSNEARAGMLTILLYILLAAVVRIKAMRKYDKMYPQGWKEVIVDEWMWEVIPAQREPIDWHKAGQAVVMTLVPFVAIATFALVYGLILLSLGMF